jgi:anti-sigma B factor antagonist
MPSTPPYWRVLTHQVGDLTIVRLSGKQVTLEEANALWLRDRLVELVAAGQHRLALDLGNVDFLTSTMVEVLLALNRKLRELGGGLSLHNLKPPVAEVFAVLQLADVLDVHTTPPGSVLRN